MDLARMDIMMVDEEELRNIDNYRNDEYDVVDEEYQEDEDWDFCGDSLVKIHKETI
jgi:hypothetical protein